MTFGSKLKKLRKEKALTQEALAVKLNVSRQAIAKWEKDECLPDINHITMLSKIFEVKIDELLDYKVEEITSQESFAENLSKEDSKLKNIYNFMAKRFEGSSHIWVLNRERKWGFWANLFDFFVGAGTIDMVDMLSTGLVYSFLVEGGGTQKLVLVQKTEMFVKDLNNTFVDKKLTVDNYKYTKTQIDAIVEAQKA